MIPRKFGGGGIVPGNRDFLKRNSIMFGYFRQTFVYYPKYFCLRIIMKKGIQICLLRNVVQSHRDLFRTSDKSGKDFLVFFFKFKIFRIDNRQKNNELPLSHILNSEDGRNRGKN